MRHINVTVAGVPRAALDRFTGQNVLLNAEGSAMCGITGWVGCQRDLAAQGPVIEAMTQTMACRGPDDSGVALSQHAALGHRRLAVIDLPGGRQPMTAELADGAVTLVYSGECYNYTELRDELRRRGHLFRTDSDTEVVLRGYLEWGDEVVGLAQRHVRLRNLGYAFGTAAAGA
jgi:asparagine synthetase B (glutamine-hydrolysing)